MSIQIYYSNHTIPLASRFAEMQLEEKNIFSPPTVIVPNPHLKKWLQLFTAANNGISSNLKFNFLEEGLLEVLHQTSSLDEKYEIMTSSDLSLYIYYLLINQEKYSIKVFTNFLDPSISSFHKKAWQLSSVLSKNLIEYELSREDIIESWNRGKLFFNTEIENYQYIIYQNIFKKNGIRDLVNKSQMTLPQLYSKYKNSLNKKSNLKMYMFGLSQITPLQTKMIYELGEYINFEIFKLNPCSEFWEDVSTPAEDRWGKIKEIEIISKEGHIVEEELGTKISENELLKLWGKPGRESIKLLSLLEEAGSQRGILTSDWINYDNTESSNSVLKLLQDQVLYRSTEKNKIQQDKSLQVIACPDIYREVESVYNNILYNLEIDPDLLMTDISIMVPDMSLYMPVIRYIFNNGKAAIRYSMIDSNASINSIFASAINSLIKLIQGNFSRTEIFEFLTNPCFTASQKLSRDDIDVWIEWADNLNIFHDYIKKEKGGLKSNNFTWSKALTRLRFGRIMESSAMGEPDFSQYKDITPYEDLNTGKQDLVESLSYTIETLYAKISKIKISKLNSVQWVNRLNDLIEKFIQIPEELPEEAVVRNSLLQNLNKLLVLGDLPSEEQNYLDFDFISDYIKECLINTPGSIGSYLIDGINISSLVPKRQIPFKISYILGMQEGIFPGSSEYSSLDLKKLNRKIGDITRADANRYLFLENLILTSDKFYLTYLSMDLQKDQEYYPNSLVNQLISYLNKFILTEDFIITNLPFNVFNVYYLQYNESELMYNDFINYKSKEMFNIINFSNHSRKLLYKKHNLEEQVSEEKSSPYFHKFKTLTTETEGAKDKVYLKIQDVKTFILNPVDLTIKYHMRIYDNNEENRASISEEPLFSTFPFDYNFIIDTLNFYISYNNIKSLDKYISNYYNYSKNMGETPEGSFGDLDLSKYRKVIHDRIQYSNNQNMSLSQFLESKNDYNYYKKIYVDNIKSDDENEVYLTPLTIATENGMDIELSGSMQHFWVSKDNSGIETLVVTSSKSFSYKTIISPFIFNLILKLKASETLSEFSKYNKFIINVCHGEGVSKLSYELTTEECSNYLYPLINEMISDKSFDTLPFQIIMGKSVLIPTDSKSNTDIEGKIKYRNQLVESINREMENSADSLYQSGVMGLLPINVPEDAFDKVFARYNIFTKHQEDKI